MWTKKDSEKAAIFLKIEPYLTFLNIMQMMLGCMFSEPQFP
jgi:hypothetical protein